MTLPTLYTPDEVAKHLRKPVAWLEDAARRKEIPHTRLGRTLRFTQQQVEQLIAQREVTEPEIGPPRRGPGVRPAASLAPRRLPDHVRAQLQ
ncbi:helix-turn-helix domain-containing protein [Nocardia puris]|uniref:Excisionase family DNA binding protein n=2 Tax=Nocardia puris TaxID=208602 RepID=A0A366DN74_9NOCA|nr:excisionase family DNA binding protein [Nocardia puris]